MFRNKLVHRWILPVLFMFAGPVAAQTDSSADAGPGFVAKVEAANGVILRVPINQLGQENTSQAEMRLHLDDIEVTSVATAETVWERATSIEAQPIVTDSDIEDGSTYGWWGYRRSNWSNAYYYNTYRPRYFYYGTYYNYSQPYYYNNWNYRYYYYPYRYYY